MLLPGPVAGRGHGLAFWGERAQPGHMEGRGCDLASLGPCKRLGHGPAPTRPAGFGISAPGRGAVLTVTDPPPPNLPTSGEAHRLDSRSPQGLEVERPNLVSNPE